MFDQIFPLYGRQVILVPFNATGATATPSPPRPTRSRSASSSTPSPPWGPDQTPAYEDELARLHVLCLGCGDSATAGQIQQNAPYQWANLPTADTSILTRPTTSSPSSRQADAI